jgi:hypothetical protein
MKLSLIREYDVNDKTVEFLFEIDDEFIKRFEEETGQLFSEEAFDEYINERLSNAVEGEDWKHEDDDDDE